MSDLESVIRESISDLPDSGISNDVGDPVETADSITPEPTDLSAETPDASGDVQPDTAAPAVEPPVAEDDLLATEFKGKEANRLPYKRVKAIVENQKTKLKAEFDEQLAAERQKFAQYEDPEFKGQLAALEVASSDPARFLQGLAQHPAYAQILAPLFEQPRQPERTPQETAVEPDVDLGNGMRGYSPRAVQAMLAREAEAVEQRIAQRFEQQFGPVVQDYRQTQFMRTAAEKVRQQVAEAETWPGFAENKAEIAAALQADTKLSLDAAYRKVVLPKLTASKDDIRKQVLAEMKQRPQRVSGLAPSAARTAPAPTDRRTSSRDARRPSP